MSDPQTADTDSEKPLNLEDIANDFDRIEAALADLDAQPAAGEDTGAG